MMGRLKIALAILLSIWCISNGASGLSLRNSGHFKFILDRLGQSRSNLRNPWGRSGAPRLHDPPTVDIDRAFVFFNPTSVAKKAADFNDDPEVTLLDKGMGHLVLARISGGPFGSWDLVQYSPGSAQLVNTSVTASRVTAGYASDAKGCGSDSPIADTCRPARFDWATRSDGREDVKIYSPPDSNVPDLVIRGLTIWKYTAIPITGLPIAVRQTLVSNMTVDKDGKAAINGHWLNDIGFKKAILSLALFESIESRTSFVNPAGFWREGAGFLNGTRIYIDSSSV
eukprot:jgi/Botrbrau1/11215/Bobra.0075s0011.1